MKIRELIALSVAYTVALGVINVYSIIASHEFYYIILPFLADPITHFILYMGWSEAFKAIPILEFLFFVPIFWPIVIFILLVIKNKLAPYVILILIYIFIFSITLYRLIQEPKMILDTIASLAVFVEPVGVVVFVVGQIWIFKLLRLKRKGRLFK